MSVTKPTFVETIKAVENYPAASDDYEFAQALKLTEAHHVPTEDDADSNRHYGLCRGCGEPWPCGVWTIAHQSAVGWLISASNEVMAHAREVMRRQTDGEAQQACLGCERGWLGHGPTCPVWPGSRTGS